MLIAAQIILMSLLLLAAVRGLDIAGGWVIRRMLAQRLARRCRGLLVLTYDDGPGVALQPQLLALLDEYDARATFFVLGSAAQAHPQAVAALLDNGHEIANHGQAHVNAWKVGPGRVVHDIRTAERSIDSARPIWRPPLGRLTLVTWMWCLLSKRPVGMWTVDGEDSLRSQPDEDTIRRVVRAVISPNPRTRQPCGGCVLLHSFDRGDGPAGATRHIYVLEATRALLAAAGHHGLQVVALGEVLGGTAVGATPSTGTAPDPIPAIQSAP